MKIYFYLFFEIRYRLLFIFLSCILIYSLCYIYKQTLIYIIIKPIFFYYNTQYFIFTNITDILYVYWSTLIFFTFHFLLLYFWFNVYCFLIPGLYNKEIHFLKIIYLFITIIWFSMLLFFYNIIIPYIWSFFLYFNNLASSFLLIKNNIQYHIPFLFFEAKLIEYFNIFFNIYFLSTITVFFFLSFVVFLNFIYTYKIKFLKLQKSRKLIYFLSLIFVTLITPPDVFSQLICSFFIFFNFEILILSLFTFKKLKYFR